MKNKVVFIIPIIAAIFSSCSTPEEKAQQEALEEFKNKLDDPSSFEFVEWGKESYVCRVHDRDSMSLKAKSYYISSGRKLDSAMYTESLRANDTAEAYSFLSHNEFKLYPSCPAIQLYDINTGKDIFCNSSQYKIIKSYLSNAKIDTLFQLQEFVYRANNKNGALEKFNGKVSWRGLVK